MSAAANVASDGQTAPKETDLDTTCRKDAAVKDNSLTDTGGLAIAAWVVIALLSGTIAVDIGAAAAAAARDSASWLVALQAGGRRLFTALPSLIVIGVLWDFADLFRRMGQGDVFSPRTIRSLRGAGWGLILAAVASVVIVPSGLGWASGGRGQLHVATNDLAFVASAVGAALLGLSRAFAEGIRLTAEADGIV
jgi:hypothetical protein